MLLIFADFCFGYWAGKKFCAKGQNLVQDKNKIDSKKIGRTFSVRPI